MNGIDPTPRDLGRGAWVGWRADRLGYTVTVYDPESVEVYSYDAGNDPGESSGVIPLDSKRRRLPLQTIRKFAKQTAQDIASEWNVNLSMIQDESGE